jgi:hypothetical protein
MSLNEQMSLMDYLNKQGGFNFFIYEDRSDDFLYYFRQNNTLTLYSGINYELSTGMNGYKRNTLRLMEGGRRGVVFTIPNQYDYAFMQWYTVADLKRKAASLDLSYTRGTGVVKVDPDKPFAFLPTPAVASLFANLKQGDAVQVTLGEADVFGYEEGNYTPDWYNREIRQMAADNGLALVDLNAIYRRIREGAYVTDDGLKIDGSPKGNFFSADGTYPTALGHAVIANEVIKAINKAYRTTIPLVNIKAYLQETGLK